MKKILGSMLVLFLLLGNSYAQSGNFLNGSTPGLVMGPTASSNHLSIQPVKETKGHFAHYQRNQIFPEYVRENPQGFSYFCRLELAVEKKLPIGLWVKIEESPNIDNGPINQAYVRLKLFKF